MANLSQTKWIEEALLVPMQPVKEAEVILEDDMITVTRTYYRNGTHGVMEFPDGTKFYTLERPWMDNERRISCIPEGDYDLRLRHSPVVQRTSGGEFVRGWEVRDVPDRTFIMLHPGNYVRNSDGCLLLGQSQSFHGGEPVVWSSREAFRQFMAKASERDEWRIRFTSEGVVV